MASRFEGGGGKDKDDVISVLLGQPTTSEEDLTNLEYFRTYAQYMQLCICTYVHTHECTCTYTHTHPHIYRYIYTHIYHRACKNRPSECKKIADFLCFCSIFITSLLQTLMGFLLQLTESGFYILNGS